MINHGADHASTIYIGRELRGLAERNMDGTAGIGAGKGLGGPSPWDKGARRPDNGMRWSGGQGFSEDEPSLDHKKKGGGG